MGNQPTTREQHPRENRADAKRRERQDYIRARIWDLVQEYNRITAELAASGHIDAWSWEFGVIIGLQHRKDGDQCRAVEIDRLLETEPFAANTLPLEGQS